jgi:inner membrane protein
MGITHAAFSVAIASIGLGTANPIVLGCCAIASQFPDLDTSKSTVGRLLFPISRWIEKKTTHRSITHSFLATGIFTLITYPIAFVGYANLWQALVLGYFLGWFADVFTKSGVAAFYPSIARLVIPGNPRLRLGTRSNAEWFLLFLLIAIAILSINLNSAGGLMRGLNQGLGLPSGAMETVNEDASRYLLVAHIRGRNAITEQPVDGEYEVIEPLTTNDLLVKDAAGVAYRVGQSQECQIVATQIRIQRLQPIRTAVKNLVLDDEEIYAALSSFSQSRTYISGTLAISDADDLLLPTHLDRFDTITLQPGSSIAYARLISASPQEVIDLLGDYYASGSLIIRTISVS